MSRSLSLPSGVISVQPDELLVDVNAGTSMTELRDVLAAHGQRVRVPTIGTVGGTLAARRNGPYEADNHSLPNIVLRIFVKDGEGRAFRAGGTTVKNVSGFDLVKVLVGSRGTLATILRATLRTEPIPAASRWFKGTGSTAVLYRPTLVIPGSDCTYVNLEGHPDDVEEQFRLLVGYDEIEAPGDEWLVEKSQHHLSEKNPDPATHAICRRLKASFDPHNRLSSELSVRMGLL